MNGLRSGEGGAATGTSWLPPDAIREQPMPDLFKIVDEEDVAVAPIDAGVKQLRLVG